MNYTPVYLVMITANNNNKYYRMIPHGDTFEVEYGRVGGSCQRATYPIQQWHKKYNEKINKGYVDQTELMLDLIHKEEPQNVQYKEIENAVIAQIVARLQDMASKTIQSNYRVDAMAVTQAMVDEAQKHIDNLADKYNKMTIKHFNDSLLKLFAIIPRKMKKVNDWLATDSKQFADIVTREQELLDVMKGQVVQHIITAEQPTEDNNEPKLTILDAMGLVFEEVTQEDIDRIKTLMGNSAHRFKNAWKVKNLKTEKAFNQFVQDENIQDVRDLWHGSKNQNWWSIIKTNNYFIRYR